MKIIDCVQGTSEWHAARAGIPTASEFKTVLRERGVSKGSESVTRRAYINKLAGERITGGAVTHFSATVSVVENAHDAEAAIVTAAYRVAQAKARGMRDCVV